MRPFIDFRQIARSAKTKNSLSHFSDHSGRPRSCPCCSGDLHMSACVSMQDEHSRNTFVVVVQCVCACVCARVCVKPTTIDRCPCCFCGFFM